MAPWLTVVAGILAILCFLFAGYGIYRMLTMVRDPYPISDEERAKLTPRQRHEFHMLRGNLLFPAGYPLHRRAIWLIATLAILAVLSFLARAYLSGG